MQRISRMQREAGNQAGAHLVAKITEGIVLLDRQALHAIWSADSE